MDEARGAQPLTRAGGQGWRFTRDFEVNLVGFPPAILPIIAADVEACRALVPPWCTAILVEWMDIPVDDADGGITIASTVVQYHYRQASIAIRPIYFSPQTTDDERRANLAHEFVHILLAPATDFARDRFEDLTDPNSHLRRNYEREWRERVESVTEDVAGALGLMRRPEVCRAAEQRRGGQAQAPPSEG